MEWLDIVNDEDVVIGKELRTKVHQLGLQHRGVHVFLFTQDGKMLIQKRSADRAASPSMLDCSVSEHVKAGESYLDAAMRGLHEEMGLDGIDIKPLVKFKMNYGANDNEISTLYKGTVEPSTVKFDTVEIEQIAYYGIDEIKDMMKDETTLCGWFIQIMNWQLGLPTKLTVLKVY